MITKSSCNDGYVYRRLGKPSPKDDGARRILVERWVRSGTRWLYDYAIFWKRCAASCANSNAGGYRDTTQSSDKPQERPRRFRGYQPSKPYTWAETRRNNG